MGVIPELKQSRHEEQVREALNRHWHASASGDADAEHDIYDEDAICEYPQSGERILGRRNLQALRSHHPGKPSGFTVRRILGKADLWITEYGTSRIPSRRQPGAASGFSGSRDILATLWRHSAKSGRRASSNFTGRESERAMGIDPGVLLDNRLG